MDVAPLAEDTEQISGRSARCFQEVLQSLGWRTRSGRESVATVVVLHQDCQKPHQTGLIAGSAPALADKLGEPCPYRFVLLVGFNDFWAGLAKKHFVCRH